MPDKVRERRRKKKVYDSSRKRRGAADCVSRKAAQSRYMKKKPEAIAKARIRYEKENPAAAIARRKRHMETHKEDVSASKKRYVEKNPEAVAASKNIYRRDNPEKVVISKVRYARDNPEKVGISKVRYARDNPEKVGISKDRYVRDNPEKVVISKVSYARDNPEAVAASKDRYVRDNPQKVAVSKTRYAAGNAEKVAASKKRSASRKPESVAARSKRYRSRKRGLECSDKEDRGLASIRKEVRKQRRFIDLVAAREYSYIGNRAVLRSGRIVTQQKMVRHLQQVYAKHDKNVSVNTARKIVQVCVNVRNKKAKDLRAVAMRLKAKSDKLLNDINTNPNISLEDLCGPSGHRKNAEPFLSRSAYRYNMPCPLRLMKWRYRYGFYRARAAVMVARCILSRNPFRYEEAAEITKMARAKELSLLRELEKEKENEKMNPPLRYWPCDPRRCYYPPNAVEKIADVADVFVNPALIRVKIADNEIDACSNVESRSAGMRGHSTACLLDRCSSRLMFLHQLAVHFSNMSTWTRRIYHAMQLDRELQEIDEAFITANTEYLEQVFEKEKKDHPGAVSEVDGEEEGCVPEDALDSKPYMKRFQDAIEQRCEFACASCRMLFLRKEVHEITVQQNVAPPLRRVLRTRKAPIPTLLVNGRRLEATKWNDLWAQLYSYLVHTGDASEQNDHDDETDYKQRKSGRSVFAVCDKCYQCIKDGRCHAPQSVFNNLAVDEVPPEIAVLNDFELLCVQLGKCFQVVVRAGALGSKMPASDQLRKLRGQVMYYPLPLEKTIEQLSEAVAAGRVPDMHILVNSVPTKSRIIWQAVINLNKVKKALQWLKANNVLYKEVDLGAWMARIERFIADKNLEEEADDDEEEEETAPAAGNNPNDSSHDKQPGSDHDDQLARLGEELAQNGVFGKAADRPMFYPVTGEERVRILDSFTIHPLEVQKPQMSDLEMYQMQRVEGEKVDNRHKLVDMACFPALFPKGRFGVWTPRDEPLSRQQWVKNRLLNQDPRFRRDHQYIFHCLWTSEMNSVATGIFQTLRRSRRNDTMSAAQLVKEIEQDNRQLECDLTVMFQRMRGTGEYWKHVNYELLCMIRNLGPPTFFLTLSAAEYDWEDMLSALRASNRDLRNVDNMRTSTLCALDPVTCQGHFHRRFAAFFNEVLLNADGGPLGVIVDYFWRIEYQSRGMPHYHILLWVKDAPRIGIDPDDTVKGFIRRYISCRMPDPQRELDLNRLVNDYQVHDCRDKYCKKTVKTRTGFITKCRFGFPRPVRTEVVLNNALDTLGKRSVGKYEKRLYEMPRKEEEERVNDYNAEILLAWRANMDLQFVGESTMAVANYVCGYVTKGERTSSEIWADIDKNKTLCEQLYAYAFEKLRHRECGVIEAVDILLGQSLYMKSRQTKYINARMPAWRTAQLKAVDELRKLPPGSTDKYLKNWVDDYYPNRPAGLDDVCLYDFIRLYEKCENPSRGMRFITNEVKGGVKMRSKPLLISHPVFKKLEQGQEYRYSLLMMFKPFRRELDELTDENGDCSTVFDQELTVNSDLAEYHDKMQAEVLQLAAREEAIKEAQEAEKRDQEQLEEGALVENQDMQPFGSPVCRDEQHLYDPVKELAEAMAYDGPNKSNQESSWEEDFASMNADQRRVFETIRARLQNDQNENAFRMFVSGEGGTGKSFLIHGIKKYIQEHFSADTEGPITVAIAAPTGLAAFNVNGVTLHRLFKLPVQHGARMTFVPLEKSELKQLYCCLRDLVLLIIDEISMVSNMMLLYTDARLREIFRSKQPLGGKNVLVLGDLAQLSPVSTSKREKVNVFDTVSGKTIADKQLGLGAVNIWQRDFTLYDELTINMRQKDDPEYAAILSRLRFGQMTEQDARKLSERLVNLDPPPKAAGKSDTRSMLETLARYYLELQQQQPDVVCLLPTSRMVSEFNAHLLANTVSSDGNGGKNDQQLVSLVAVDRVHGCRSKAEKDRAREQLKRRAANVTTTAGLEVFLDLSVGTRVMLRRNVNVAVGLVNGAMGTVKGFERGAGGKVTGVLVHFDHMEEPCLVERVSSSFDLTRRVSVHLQQFPLIVAYAITLHKSQGISLSSVLLDVGSKTFQTGMAYVGLSRVRTLKGLHLINFDPSKAKCSLDCIMEVNHLRSLYLPNAAQLPLTMTKLTRRKDRVWYEQVPAVDDDLDVMAAVCDPTAVRRPAAKQRNTKRASKSTNRVRSGTNDVATKRTGRVVSGKNRCTVDDAGGAVKEQRSLRKPTTPVPSLPFAHRQQDRCLVTPDQEQQQMRLILPGFVNRDNESCYANSAWHLLCSVAAFRDFIANCDASGQLPAVCCNLWNQYRSRECTGGITGVENRPLTARSIREVLGGVFLAGQQCAREFVEVLLDRMGFGPLFRLHYQYRCLLCDYQWAGDETQLTSCAVVDPRDCRDFEWQLMNRWKDESAQQCPSCENRVAVQTSVDVKDATQILVHVLRHGDGDDFNQAPIAGCNHDMVVLSGSKYKVTGVIQHFGATMNSGHYVALINRPEGWIRCDDQRISKCQFPIGLLDVYLMVLEKQSSDAAAPERSALVGDDDEYVSVDVSI